MWKLLIMLVGVVMGLNAVDKRPPGAYGFEGQVTVLSETPRIFYIEKFLTDAECNHLMERAKPQLKRSTVVSNALVNGNVDQVDAARTSQGMFLERPSWDKIVQRVEKKIADLTRLPESHGEGMQILRYALGGEYRPHYDYFDPHTPGGAACYNRGGQRVASMIIYLTDTEEGGETIFPEVGVAVQPVKGSAVLFYNCTPDGKEDPLSLHGGAPVLKGEKWVAVKWLRKGVFQ